MEGNCDVVGVGKRELTPMSRVARTPVCEVRLSHDEIVQLVK